MSKPQARRLAGAVMIAALLFVSSFPEHMHACDLMLFVEEWLSLPAGKPAEPCFIAQACREGSFVPSLAGASMMVHPQNALTSSAVAYLEITSISW